MFDPPFEQGYGDLSPTKDESRYFAALMILIGVVFIFSAVAGLIVELTAPLTLRGRELLEKIFPQIGVDLDGSGDFDFFEPRHPVIYYSKNLLPSILLTVVVQLVSAAIFTHVDSTWSFGIALYHCFVTATTVGYGDVSNSTQNGRLWSCFHILISVAMLGEIITTLDHLRDARRTTFERIRMLTTRLNGQMLDNMLQHAKTLRPLVERDGLGLTELEFVLAMMLELGVVELQQVQPFIKQFRLLDDDGNARLSREDLAATENKSLAELQAASQERIGTLRKTHRLSVGSRMGGVQLQSTRTLQIDKASSTRTLPVAETPANPAADAI